MLQIVIYKKLNFWEEYTPLMRVFKGDISYLVYNLGKSVHAQKNSGSRSVKTLGFLFSTTKYSCVVLGWFHSISRNKCLTSPKQRLPTELYFYTLEF